MRLCGWKQQNLWCVSWKDYKRKQNRNIFFSTFHSHIDELVLERRTTPMCMIVGASEMFSPYCDIRNLPFRPTMQKRGIVACVEPRVVDYPEAPARRKYPSGPPHCQPKHNATHPMSSHAACPPAAALGSPSSRASPTL